MGNPCSGFLGAALVAVCDAGSAVCTLWPVDYTAFT